MQPVLTQKSTHHGSVWFGLRLFSFRVNTSGDQGNNSLVTCTYKIASLQANAKVLLIAEPTLIAREVIQNILVAIDRWVELSPKELVVDNEQVEGFDEELMSEVLYEELDDELDEEIEDALEEGILLL